MTDYTKLTGIERGHNAFTSTAKSMLITQKDKGHATRAAQQTKRVETLRKDGLDLGTFHGISAKSDELVRKHKAITQFKHAPAFNVTLASADDSRRTAAIKGRG
jgi:hypothetical protein